MRALTSFLILPALFGCVSIQTQKTGENPKSIRAAPDQAVAEIADKDGRAVGTAKFEQDMAGITLTVSLSGLQPGEYGMHVHGVGKCDGPDFASAGGHWNPLGRQHGLNNAMGSHAGDVPNVSVGQNGKVVLKFNLSGARLSGDGGVLDADGAAIIIHAKPDDNITDPSGNSGARIACGVLKQLIF